MKATTRSCINGLLSVQMMLACVACATKSAPPISTAAPATTPQAVSCRSVKGMGSAGIIDDFESEPNRLVRTDDRDGYWFSYNDGSGGKLIREEISSDTQLLHVTSSGFSKWGAGVGATFVGSTTMTRACGYDASAYAGIRFRARGRGRMRVQMASIKTTPLAHGGECSRSRENCYDSPGTLVDLQEQWQIFERPFCSFFPEGWGGDRSGLDPDKLVNIQFKIPPRQQFELWLDDLSFYASSNQTTEPHCGPPCPLESVSPNAKLNPSASSAPLSDELTLHTFQQTTKRCGALTRRYLSFVPKGLGQSSSAPLLMALHGSEANAEAMLEFMTHGRFNELAKRDGFIVVYPNAAPGEHTVPGPYLADSGVWRQDFFDDGEVDDVAYLLDTLNDLKARGVIDGNNAVFLTGISNGGGMILKAAKQAPERFRGIAPVTAFDGRVPTPVPDLRGKGLNRVLFVYTIGDPGLSPGYHEVLKTLPAQWATAMGLPMTLIQNPTTVALPDRIREGVDYRGKNSVALATRDSHATALDMADATLNLAVRVVVLDHAGHFWPHPRGESYAWAIDRWGFRNQDFDAADLVWDFFSKNSAR